MFTSLKVNVRQRVFFNYAKRPFNLRREKLKLHTLVESEWFLLATGGKTDIW